MAKRRTNFTSSHQVTQSGAGARTLVIPCPGGLRPNIRSVSTYVSTVLGSNASTLTIGTPSSATKFMNLTLVAATFPDESALSTEDSTGGLSSALTRTRGDRGDDIQIVMTVDTSGVIDVMVEIEWVN